MLYDRAVTPGKDQIEVVLASQSPRRRDLLLRAGVVHSVAPRLVDDTHLCPGAVKPGQWATALAYLKAVGAARALGSGPVDARGGAGLRTLVLGADTVVVKGDRLIGKAENPAEAREIIETLSDGEHEVVTGVALVEMGGKGSGSVEWRRLFADTARVRVGAISPADLAAYVSGDGWRGKAGAYNLEERVQAGWPISWSGDPTTVMGLPMARLVPMLRDWGVVIHASADGGMRVELRDRRTGAGEVER